MATTTIDRTFFDALVDDSGSGDDGSIWDKADIEDLLDAIDAILAGDVELGGDLVIPGTLDVTGLATFEGDLATDVIAEATSAAGVTVDGVLLKDGGAALTASLFVGDATNAVNALGLTVNQGAADDEIVSLKSSDIDHGMTSVTEADTFVLMKKLSANNGGLHLRALSETTTGVAIEADHTVDNTTKSTGGRGAVRLIGGLRSGTGVGALGADANILTVENNGTTRFIFDAEGSAHADVEWTTFDTHDDLALLDTLDATLSARDAVTNRFGEALLYNADALQAAGIVNFYDDGPRVMLNTTRLAMLHTGALRQIGRDLATIKRALSYARLLPEAV